MEIKKRGSKWYQEVLAYFHQLPWILQRDFVSLEKQKQKIISNWWLDFKLIVQCKMKYEKPKKTRKTRRKTSERKTKRKSEVPSAFRKPKKSTCQRPQVFISFSLSFFSLSLELPLNMHSSYIIVSFVLFLYVLVYASPLDVNAGNQKLIFHVFQNSACLYAETSQVYKENKNK